MKIIRNNIIPFPGYKAMMLFGILFVRKKARIDDVTIRHESIHCEQMKETLFIGFYIWYVVEYLVRLVLYRNLDEAYRNISFEQEAYFFEGDSGYLDRRPHYVWFRYLKRKTYNI